MIRQDDRETRKKKGRHPGLILVQWPSVCGLAPKRVLCSFEVILVSSWCHPRIILSLGFEKRFGAAVILASSFDFWSERPQKKKEKPRQKKRFSLG